MGEQPTTTEGPDPRQMSLADLAEAARAEDAEAGWQSGKGNVSKGQQMAAHADHLMRVLAARVTLEAAETTRSLVKATWWLVAATIAIALVAIGVALFAS